VKERRRCSQGVKYRFVQGRANKGPPLFLSWQQRQLREAGGGGGT
jgi:hypothetical protein